jgi:alpha-D-ribose 1-methylphosphonate 5-triphosphate synthase subunit PhnG
MISPTASGDSAGTPARKELMRVCADATEAEMEAALAPFGDLAAADDIRPPQTGLVMLRGRIGGNGPPFNIGEATVTRAAVRLAGGEMGFAYLLGRSHRRARLAAVLDALGQHEDRRQQLQRLLVEPVTARRNAERATQRAEVAATRVDFFTLVRGEDRP